MMRFFYTARRWVRPLTRKLQFFLINTFYIDGPSNRLSYGKGCALNNAIFNTSSGKIVIGDNVAFGYNVMVLTGRHCFMDGKRISLLTKSNLPEVPCEGFDITIGGGSWIASNVIFTGRSSVGENCIVYASSVVTKTFPPNSRIAGIPAKVIGSTLDEYET